MPADACLPRCQQGRAPRSECHPKLWRTRPPRPVEPLRGASAEGLERSVREQVGTTYYSDGGRALAIRCADRSACLVTYGREGDNTTRFTVRYSISARAGTPSCWFAARTKILRRPRDLTLLDLVGAQDGPSENPKGCIRD